MIAQVLNRDFLLLVADEVRRDLEREVEHRGARRRRRGPPSELDNLTKEELDETVELLREATADRERLEPAPGGGDPSDEAGARPKDDFAYIPQDAMLSLIQTALEERFETDDSIEVV